MTLNAKGFNLSFTKFCLDECLKGKAVVFEHTDLHSFPVCVSFFSKGTTQEVQI